MIKAWAEIKKFDPPPCKCLVLGRDRKAAYVRLTKRFGLSKEVIFADSTEEPEKYYGAADLFAHPTFYDACSLTILEALASGLPVITTTSNGAGGIVTQGEEGWIIRNRSNIEELRNAIRYFFDKGVRHRASQQARGKAEVYSEKINFDRIEGIFKDTLKHSETNYQGNL